MSHLSDKQVEQSGDQDYSEASLKEARAPDGAHEPGGDKQTTAPPAKGNSSKSGAAPKRGVSQRSRSAAKRAKIELSEALGTSSRVQELEVGDSGALGHRQARSGQSTEGKEKGGPLARENPPMAGKRAIHTSPPKVKKVSNELQALLAGSPRVLTQKRGRNPLEGPDKGAKRAKADRKTAGLSGRKVGLKQKTDTTTQEVKIEQEAEGLPPQRLRSKRKSTAAENATSPEAKLTKKSKATRQQTAQKDPESLPSKATKQGSSSASPFSLFTSFFAALVVSWCIPTIMPGPLVPKCAFLSYRQAVLLENLLR